ncbi:serine/threonine-protein phosphatase 6 regulatory subunit [Anaeramoeba flamelloides]|uniref:Serine/threonine-protein phosphatase 6 regulatory subunit n=1 Tax=Anaeramoeba flamelloides TaxID=1746091 RepID=A0AAV7YTP2_9EUKA|nr:serine/threonine-protein phosphatase 6 regulatory subunit [Anaeramoeba flamelloides]
MNESSLMLNTALKFTNQSKIDSILSKEKPTLEELLNEDDLLQECRYGNKKLLKFLTNTKNLKKLLIYLLVDPKTTNENQEISKLKLLKFPYLVNEIICLELTEVVESITENEDLMIQIFEFLKQPKPLNTVYSGYFAQMIGTNLRLKYLETITFLMKHDYFIEKLLENISISGVCDVMIHILVFCEENVYYQETIKWLTKIEIMKRIFSLLDQKNDEDTIDNSTKCLLEVIANSTHEIGELTLVACIETETFSKKILEIALSKESSNFLREKAILVILEILIYIGENERIYLHTNNQNEEQQLIKNEKNIEKNNKNNNDNDYNEDYDQQSVSEYELEQYMTHPLLVVIVENFSELIELLQTALFPKTKFHLGSIKYEPFGQLRIKIVSLFHIFTHLQFVPLQELLCKNKIFSLMLDLLFKYPWNNFLHNQIRDMFCISLETEIFCYHLLEETDFLNRLLKEFTKFKESEENNSLIGYISHLFNIANKIVELSDEDEKSL